MENLELTFVGMDSWDRPVYKDINDNLFKDVDPRAHMPADICTTSSFEGEPDTSIFSLNKYKNMKVKFIPRRIVW